MGIAAALLWAPDAVAHTFKQLNVIVNQLGTATLPNARNRQNEINDIYKQCDAHGIRIRVAITKTKNNQDPEDAFGKIAPGGVVPDRASVGRLIIHAQGNEVEKGGYKVWVAKELKAEDLQGADTAGRTALGMPVSVVVQQSGIVGAAHTWAHEIGHGLGLDHDDAGVDENHLMFEALKRQNGNPAGDTLTEAQCQKMNKTVNGYKPSTEKNKDQQLEPDARSKQSKAVEPAQPESSEDTDIRFVMVGVDSDLVVLGESHLSVDFSVHGDLVDLPAPDYRVWLDLDDNASTGDASGFDAYLRLEATSPTAGTLYVYDLPANTLQSSAPLDVSPTILSSTSEVQGSQSSFGTRLHGAVSLDVLEAIAPLSPLVRFTATSDDGVETDAVGPEFVETGFSDVPTLATDVDEAGFGELVQVTGAQLDASSPYVLLFDDQEVASGVTSGSGGISAVFTVPPRPADDYVIDAITTQGTTAIAVLRHAGSSVPSLSWAGLASLLLVLGLVGVRATWGRGRLLR
jgi:hypothetical protein